MIFATVGTQLPFDRLLQALDGWAAQRPNTRVLAQTGRSGADFAHMECQPFLDQAQFAEAMQEADVIVSHAGMGSILTAAELGKPVLILARQSALGEHRTDHQLATAEKMRHLPNVTVALDAGSLGGHLDALMSAPDAGLGAAISPVASDALLTAVSGFIRTGALGGASGTWPDLLLQDPS